MSQQKGQPIVVYVDGAHNHHARFGSWAFYVPSLDHDASGSEPGPVNQHFELMAALKALQWIERERPGLAPIEIRTDCTHVQFWVREVRERILKYSKRNDYPRHSADLLRQIDNVMQRRKVYTAHVNSHQDLAHARCHKLANELLTVGIQEDPRMREAVAAKDPEAELNRLLKTRKLYVEKLNEVDAEIAEKYPNFRMSSNYLRWAHWRFVLLYSWRIKSKGMGYRK